MSKKVLLLNDCSDNRHFGSRMVTEAFYMNVEARGHTLKTVKRGHLYSDSMLEWADVVLVNAEGCIHDGKYEELLAVGGKHPNAVLMNGSMQNLSRHYGDELSRFKLVTVRESYSAAELAISHGFEAEVVPDIIYSLPTHFLHRSEGRFVSDSSDRQFRKERACAATDPEFVSKLTGSAAACVGRFHAAVLCSKVGVPLSAFGGNTHKLRGLMLDMGLDDLYFEEADDAMIATPRKADPSYALYAAECIRELFRDILG